eukprot:jgi/Chrzof1/6548/Cz19g00200.t1
MADILTIEHYVGECFVKCAHVILNARAFKGTKVVPDRRASRWFLLEVEEVEGVSKEVEPWRRDTSRPMIIEVYMQPWNTSNVMPVPHSQAPSNAGAGHELLLERWCLQYYRQPAAVAAASPGSPGTYHTSRSTLDATAVYKRMVG